MSHLCGAKGDRLVDGGAGFVVTPKFAQCQADIGVGFGEVRPAASMVVVAGLLDPRWKVEIEAEAIVG